MQVATSVVSDNDTQPPAQRHTYWQSSLCPKKRSRTDDAPSRDTPLTVLNSNEHQCTCSLLRSINPAGRFGYHILHYKQSSVHPASSSGMIGRGSLHCSALACYFSLLLRPSLAYYTGFCSSLPTVYRNYSQESRQSCGMSTTNSEEKTGWSTLASGYAHHGIAFTQAFAIDAIRGAVQSYGSKADKDRTSPIRCLDVAAGTGAATFALIDELCYEKSESAVSMIATDFSDRMLDQLKEQIPSKVTHKYPNVNVETRELDMHKLEGIPDNSIDICTMSFGIMFAKDPVEVIREVHRVLSPQGVAIILTWSWNSITSDLQEAALDQGKIAKLADFKLPPLTDYGNEHNVRTLALEAGVTSNQLSVSYIQKGGFTFPIPFLVSVANSNPGFAEIAPFDEKQLETFLTAKGDRAANGDPIRCVGATAMSLRIG